MPAYAFHGGNNATQGRRTARHYDARDDDFAFDFAR